MYTLETYDEPQSVDPIDLSCCIYNFASIVTEPLDDDDEA